MIVTPRKYANELKTFVTRPELEKIPIPNNTNPQVYESFAQYIDGAVRLINLVLQKSVNVNKKGQNTVSRDGSAFQNIFIQYMNQTQAGQSLDITLPSLSRQLKSVIHKIAVQWHPFLKHLCALMDEFENLKKLGAFVLDNAMKELRGNDTEPKTLYAELHDLAEKSKLRQHVLDIKVISPKLQALVDRLKTIGKGKVIVFVKTRRMAKHIKQYFDRTNSHLRVGVLVGHAKGSDCAEDRGMDYQEQCKQMQRFNGDGFDLLIATSVAEEGFDVQKCNLVVRFDTTSSLTSIIQSRGRARDRDGKFFTIYGDVIYNETKLQEIAISEKNMQSVVQSFDIKLSAELKRRRGELSFDDLYDSITNRAKSEANNAVVDSVLNPNVSARECASSSADSKVSGPSTPVRIPKPSSKENYRQRLEQLCRERGMKSPTLKPPEQLTSPFSAHVTVHVPGEGVKIFEGTGQKKKDAKNDAFKTAFLMMIDNRDLTNTDSADITAPSSISTPTRIHARLSNVNHRQQLEQFCRTHGMRIPTVELPKELTPPFSAHVTVHVHGEGVKIFEGTGQKKKDAKSDAYYKACRYYNAWRTTNSM